METSFSQFEVVFMVVILLLLFLLLVLFVASLVTSVLMLCVGWRVGPVLRKDSILLLEHRPWSFSMDGCVVGLV